MRFQLTTEPSLIILNRCGNNSAVIAPAFPAGSEERGGNSIGRVPPFQGGCCEFESRPPLHSSSNSGRVEVDRETIENQKHTHTLGLSEGELASVITKQVREALPRFVDGLEGEMSHT